MGGFCLHTGLPILISSGGAWQSIFITCAASCINTSTSPTLEKGGDATIIANKHPGAYESYINVIALPVASPPSPKRGLESVNPITNIYYAKSRPGIRLLPTSKDVRPCSCKTISGGTADFCYEYQSRTHPAVDEAGVRVRFSDIYKDCR